MFQTILFQYGFVFLLFSVVYGADKSEGEKCDMDAENVYGQCGETLVCTPVENEKYGICQCVNQDELCGNNGQTYPNLCRLVEDAIRLGNKDLKMAHLGRCSPDLEETVPVISGPPPQNVRNTTGSYIALGCEALGNPIPEIVWRFRPLHGKEKSLPGDDIRISTNTRGGPEKHQVTGWLQIMDLNETHEGDYLCIATSSTGSDKSEARVKVFNTQDLVRMKNEDL